MINLATAAKLTRTASAWDYNSAYTILYVARFGAAFTTVFGISQSDASFSSDGYQMDSPPTGNLKPFDYNGGVLANGATGATTLAVDSSVLYYVAYVRTSVTQILSYVGTTIAGVALDGTSTLSTVSGRTASSMFALNCNYPGQTAGAGLATLGRVKVYQAALTLDEIKTELSFDAPQKAGCWASYPMLTAASAATDTSGNGRDLTGSGTITDGEALADATASLITVPSGAYLYRTASIFSYNADFTVCYVMRRSSSTDTTGFAIAAANNIDNLDGTYLDSSSTMGAYTRVATVQDGIQGTGALSTATTYFCALRRTGNTLEHYIGLAPASVALNATKSLPFGARTAAAQIVFNGWIQSTTHAHFDQLGRVRAYASALTLAEIQTELASSSAVKAGVWADWRLTSPSDLTDYSGNGRDLAAVGLGPSAAVGGTGGDGMTEAEVVAGGQVITLTLTGDTWIP